MKGKAHRLITRCLDPVGYAQAPCAPLHSELPEMRGLALESAIAVVGDDELGFVAVIEAARGFHPGCRLRRPQEWSGLLGLVGGIDLQRVVRDRRAEVAPPFRLALITIGAGIRSEERRVGNEGRTGGWAVHQT